MREEAVVFDELWVLVHTRRTKGTISTVEYFCCSWYLVRKSWLRANHFSVRFSRLVGMSYYIICIAVAEYGNTKSRIFCFIISIIIICEQDILPFKDSHFFRWYKSFWSSFYLSFGTVLHVYLVHAFLWMKDQVVLMSFDFEIERIVCLILLQPFKESVLYQFL